jgi:hypothetical protein
MGIPCVYIFNCGGRDLPSGRSDAGDAMLENANRVSGMWMQRGFGSRRERQIGRKLEDSSADPVDQPLNLKLTKFCTGVDGECLVTFTTSRTAFI